MRDCVVIKADTEKEENPYVAKIGSIWQESGNIMLITIIVTRVILILVGTWNLVHVLASRSTWTYIIITFVWNTIMAICNL